MNKKSFRPRVVNILTLFVCCFLFVPSIIAQERYSSEKSLADLYQDFKTNENLPCGQRYEAVRIGRLILEKYDKDLSGKWGIYFKKRFAVLETEELKCTGKYVEKTLADLYADFETARNSPCGNRVEAIRIGKEIVEKFGNDTSVVIVDYNVVPYVKKQISLIEEEDKRCKSDAGKEFAELWENFKKAEKMSCGKRDEALRIGKFIIASYEVDAHFRTYTEFLKKQLVKIEEEEKNCKIVN